MPENGPRNERSGKYITTTERRFFAIEWGGGGGGAGMKKRKAEIRGTELVDVGESLQA